MSNLQTVHNGVGAPNRKLNQFGDYEDVTNMSVDDWDYRWSLNQTKFHMPKVHPMLQKYIDKLLNGKNRQTVFVALCGKTLDMKWLLDQGHEVVGNDCVDSACRQFFEENNIPYTSHPLDGVDGALFTATDGSSIKLYRCDCFELPKVMKEKVSCIWDRGGFVALPVKERSRYALSLRAIMKNDCRYLLDCFLLDNSKFGGPPFNCDEKDVKQAFETFCKIEKLETRDAFTKWQESWGISSFIEEVYLLHPK
ncbi:probable thiopurine S-methyltransferase isoform X6 [Dreissena polymorpha]|uniref:probable thiopurine S-methyltransferase isoform X6 n=1 Tax=Dreissena polymorpha TaxID=45954 RepID=UPI002263C24E|nr:probable thiopurine S-methyltransferase isoform X6 [Dreissena polymorpha]